MKDNVPPVPPVKLGHKVEPTSFKHTFSIYDRIEGPEEYTGLVDTLKSVGQGDMVHLRINSYGGRLDGALSILDAIRFCEGCVVAEAEGMVMSAASLIFFGSDAFTVNPHAQFLLHNGFGGEFGKPNDNLDSASFSMKSMKCLFNQVYGRYFTKREIAAICNGKEMYLLGHEVEDRLEKYMKKKQKEAES